jgi:hypothetical protein
MYAWKLLSNTLILLQSSAATAYSSKAYSKKLPSPQPVSNFCEFVGDPVESVCAAILISVMEPADLMKAKDTAEQDSVAKPASLQV